MTELEITKTQIPKITKTSENTLTFPVLNQKVIDFCLQHRAFLLLIFSISSSRSSSLLLSGLFIKFDKEGARCIPTMLPCILGGNSIDIYKKSPKKSHKTFPQRTIVGDIFINRLNHQTASSINCRLRQNVYWIASQKVDGDRSYPWPFLFVSSEAFCTGLFGNLCLNYWSKVDNWPYQYKPRVLLHSLGDNSIEFFWHEFWLEITLQLWLTLTH